MKVSQFIIKVTYPVRWYLVGPVVVMLIYGVYISLRPYLMKLIINAATLSNVEESSALLWSLVPLYIVVQFLVVACWRFYDWCVLCYEPHLKNIIAKESFEHLSLHDHHYFQNHLVGGIASKVNDLTKGVPAILTTLISSYLTNFFCLIIAMLFLYQVHPWFAILTGGWSVVMIIFSVSTIHYSNQLATQVAETAARVMGNMVDALSNMLNIRLFSARTQELGRLSSLQGTYLNAARKRLKTLLKFYSVQGVSFSGYQIICLLLLIYLHGQHLVTAGDFGMIFALNLGVVDNLWRMLSEMQIFSEHWGAVTQALKTIYVPQSTQDETDAKLLKITEAKIQFENVHFCYQGNLPLFQNKSLIIKPAEKVGLVGYSGGGKSTFVNLILRLYELSAGRILIDGQDIRSVTQDSLRAAIGLIPQDPVLFHRSLMDNIRYGRHEASDEEVVSAAKAAHAHDFIMQLPQAYESLVGERGVKLSGGQRQRVAIARAILKNAPILILDEATSQLDSVTENAIQASLGELMQGKTVIVIAHRLSTLLHMDRIVVFDRGTIAEMGTHAELLQQKGLYSQLLSAQVSGFLPLTQG